MSSLSQEGTESSIMKGAYPFTSTRNRVLLVVVTFLASLAYELWRALPQGFDTLFFGHPVTASVSQLIPALGGSDAGSYLGAALDLQDGSISPKYAWVLNLWPPGMPYILALMIKLGGGASPVLPMVILLCILWSVVLATLAGILLPRHGYLTFTVFTVFWLLSPIFTAWTIHGGVLGSDGLATALGTLVAIGLVWATLAGPSRRPRWLLYVGLGTGLAALAYLRIMWFYAVPAALGVVALFAVVRMIVLLIRRRFTQIAGERRRYIEWAALGATFLALCIPWTIYGETTLHPGSYSWSQGDYQWSQEWMTDGYLKSIGGGFLAEGGANWPCHLDPHQCTVIAAQEFASTTPYGGEAPNTFIKFEHDSIKVAIAQPGPFIVDRSAVMLRAWLSAPGAPVGTMDNLVYGVLTLVAFFAALVVLAWQSLKQRVAALVIFLIIGANVGIVWLTHFETRYMVPVQAMSLVVVAFAVLPQEARVWQRISPRRKQKGPFGDIAATAGG
jgi:hypothetical protein